MSTDEGRCVNTANLGQPAALGRDSGVAAPITRARAALQQAVLRARRRGQRSQPMRRGDVVEVRPAPRWPTSSLRAARERQPPVTGD